MCIFRLRKTRFYSVLMMLSFVLLFVQTIHADGTNPSRKSTIFVIKQTRVSDAAGGGSYYVPDRAGHTYYVRAYEDDNLQRPATAAQPMLVEYSMDSSDKGSSAYSVAKLENLIVGENYYLVETDRSGNPIDMTKNHISRIQFSVDDGNTFRDEYICQVAIASSEMGGKLIYLRNVYSAPGLKTGSFRIKLNVVDYENKPLYSALTAEFRIAGGDGSRLKNLKTIRLENESAKTLENVSYLWSGDQIRITASLQALKDSSGEDVLVHYSLIDPATYASLASGTAIPHYINTQITLHSGEKNSQTLEFTLRDNRKPSAEIPVATSQTEQNLTPITIARVPASVKTKVKKNRVTVSWKKIKKTKKTENLISQIKGVQIQYSTDPEFRQNTVTRSVGKNKTKITLKPGRNSVFYIRVRYRGNNGVSRWSSRKRVRIK